MCLNSKSIHTKNQNLHKQCSTPWRNKPGNGLLLLFGRGVLPPPTVGLPRPGGDGIGGWGIWGGVVGGVLGMGGGVVGWGGEGGRTPRPNKSLAYFAMELSIACVGFGFWFVLTCY